MKTGPNIGFLGVGNMGGALMEGALQARFLSAENTFVYDLDKERLKALSSKYPLKIQASAADCVRNSDFVFLCVKPQQMPALIDAIKEHLQAQCLVSIAAGISIASIQNWAQKSVPIVRVMPNTPALVGYGISGLCGGKFASVEQVQFVQLLLSSVGKALLLPEDRFDALTAVSGSGPAYVFYLAENLLQAAKSLGLDDGQADLLVKQTFLGAAQMMQGPQDALALRKKVTSPGGTTEAAIQHLISQNWAEHFVQAVQKAKDRSEQLTRGV